MKWASIMWAYAWWTLRLTGRRVAHNDRAETQKNESRSLTASQAIALISLLLSQTKFLNIHFYLWSGTITKKEKCDRSHIMDEP